MPEQLVRARAIGWRASVRLVAGGTALATGAGSAGFGRASRLLLVGALVLVLLGADTRPGRGAGGDVAADRVLGQPDFASSASNNPTLGGLGARSLASPVGIAVDPRSGRLFVADTGNQRILSWPSASGFGNGQAADLVLGQPDFGHSQANQGSGPTAATLSSPNAPALDGAGNLYVADNSNSRVLMYAAPFTSGMAATRVFGQPDFTSGSPNRGGSPTAGTLNHPVGVAVGQNGDVFVADTGNNRVLEYVAPIGQSQDLAASRVFGQPDFASGAANNGGLGAGSLIGPDALAVDPSGDLFLADVGNARVLEFVPPFRAAGNLAALVLGQPDFTHQSSGVSATTLGLPAGIAVDGGVWVGDLRTNRVLRYLPPFSNGMAASFVVGQPDCVSGGANSGGTSAASLFEPWNVATDPGGNLYVSDNRNNRVLGYDRPSARSGCLASPWSGTGVMSVQRAEHTATLFTSGPLAGQVLVVGGCCDANGSPLASAELYDPTSGAFRATGSLRRPRAGHRATLLPSGAVFVVGGGGLPLADAGEIYDPASGAWSGVPTSQRPLDEPSATLLPDGRVLVLDTRLTVQLYDPVRRAWAEQQPGGAAPVSLRDHSPTLLPGGRVLVIGQDAHHLYDPASQTWASTGSTGVSRGNTSATVLPSGRVWVAGGEDQFGDLIASTELYDPATDTWSDGPALLTPRSHHTATPLPDGRVLIVGGLDQRHNVVRTAELYDPNAGTVSPAGGSGTPHAHHAATLLASGKVLVAGGYFNRELHTYCSLDPSADDCLACRVQDSFDPTEAAELYDPAARAVGGADAVAQRAGAPARARVGAASGTGSAVLDTLYALRDGVMATSPQGRYYTRLYYLRSPEMVGVVVNHPSLAFRVAATLREWQPALQSLVDGRGSGATISQQMVDDLNGVLSDFKRSGSSGLAATIQQEQDTLKLQDFVGKPADQAWTQAQQRIVVRSLGSAYLPLLPNRSGPS